MPLNLLSSIEECGWCGSGSPKPSRHHLSIVLPSVEGTLTHRGFVCQSYADAGAGAAGGGLGRALMAGFEASTEVQTNLLDSGNQVRRTGR